MDVDDFIARWNRAAVIRGVPQVAVGDPTFGFDTPLRDDDAVDYATLVVGTYPHPGGAFLARASVVTVVRDDEPLHLLRQRAAAMTCLIVATHPRMTAAVAVESVTSALSLAGGLRDIPRHGRRCDTADCEYLLTTHPVARTDVIATLTALPRRRAAVAA